MKISMSVVIVFCRFGKPISVVLPHTHDDAVLRAESMSRYTT